MPDLPWTASGDLSPHALEEGRGYADAGRVEIDEIFEVAANRFAIAGTVQGRQRRPYAVDADLFLPPGGRARVDGVCSCPVGLDRKHVAALIFAADDRGHLSAPEPAGEAARPDMTDPSTLPGRGTRCGRASRPPKTRRPRLTM